MLPSSTSDQQCTEGPRFWKETRKINESLGVREEETKLGVLQMI